MTDDTNTIREESALLADWAEEPLGMSSVDVDEVRARLIAALDRVEARLAAPCHCDKCLDCLAADGYEAAIERAEQAEQERDEWKAEADRRGWPKEKAQEYHQLKARVPELERERDKLRRLADERLTAWREEANGWSEGAEQARAEANRLRAVMIEVEDTLRAYATGVHLIGARHKLVDALAGPQTEISDEGMVQPNYRPGDLDAGPQAEECEHDFVFLGAFDFRCDKCGRRSQDGVHPLPARQTEEQT